ncbi:hypothetical protein AVEN_129109-1 [Araneus ventricosus]|uniref:Peptidase A2 domain-containing protein n=1 Tax=Araneus ventricosus TaxID=182803 RepID=A0A4Y2HHJ4_ARAVE|nr:hypothetical protein AVEN_129109-1 [Araneus ventricosus]
MSMKSKQFEVLGHVQKVCIKTVLNAKSSNSPKLASNHVKTYQDIGVNATINICDNPTSEFAAHAAKHFISVKIENLFKKFEVDTGAGYTLIPDDRFKRLGIKTQLEPTGISFRSYTENVFLPLGKVRVKEENKGHVSFEDLYIALDGF